MCGIVGFTGVRDDALLNAMNDAQRHRGPDDLGCVFDEADAVSLAMRRLSIVDIAGGHQPMATADGTIWIVFNGEIMNAPALRAALEADGCRFRTDHSDTEVLLHLYATRGERMLDALNGMFAFVIHDRGRRRLFGARDHFGIKPLYYAFDGTRFAFASELKSLARVPWIDHGLEPQALSHYLSFQCVPAPHTIFRGVAKLGAAHAFSFDLQQRQLQVERYWRPPAGTESKHGMDRADLTRLVRDELEHAVERWLLSDVPIACSLSGGIDSSAIVGLMTGKLATPVRTYSLGFDDAPHLDERPLARLVARRWGTDHHEIVLSSDSLLNDLDPMVDSLDEPYGGGLPSWFVFKGMAGEVKVCMTGTGGDELFGNYRKWRVYESWWRGLYHGARLARRAGWVADWMRHPRGSRYPIYFHDCDKRAYVLEERWLRGCEPSEALIETLWKDAAAPTARDAVRIVDLQIQLPDEFLHMTDRFSMAHSIEARPPFLDRQLAEALMSVPAALRFGRERVKQVLIDAVRDLLPEELLVAPKKGLILPVSAWIRGRLRPRVEQLLGRPHLKSQGIFKQQVHERLVRPHLEGRQDRGEEIWTLLMFQLWAERNRIG